MSVQEILADMQEVQASLIDFLDAEEESEEKFSKFRSIIISQKIQEEKDTFMSLLNILSNISENHHHNSTFYDKTDQIINFFKDGLKNQFSEEEIFNIFKYSQRILLYIIKEKIITVNENMASQMCYAPIYFYPEITAFPNVVTNNLRFFAHPMIKSSIYEFKIPDNFEELRKEGENESKICKLIRNDSLDDFILFINQYSIKHDSFINYSFYETNSFLDYVQNRTLDVYDHYHCKFVKPQTDLEKTTLIEYAAFFGSIRIFNYLKLYNVKLSPMLYQYAIYGNNPEIISILEDLKIDMPTFNERRNRMEQSDDYAFYDFDEEEEEEKINNFNEEEEKIINFNEEEDKIENYNTDFNDKNNLIIAIKCIHNDVVRYFLSNKNFEPHFVLKNALEYHNYKIIEANLIDKNLLSLLCKYNYPKFVSILTKTLDLSHMIFNGQTLLYKAVKQSNYEIVKILLNNDSIDINFLNKSQNGKISVLQLALENNDMKMMELLLSNEKIDINLKNKIFMRRKGYQCPDGVHEYEIAQTTIRLKSTVLYEAVQKRQVKAIKLLLSNDKIDPNIKCKYSDYTKELDHNDLEIITEYTPLYVAVLDENIKIIELLLTNDKTDPDIMCKKEEINYITFTRKAKEVEEYSPLSRARDKNLSEILEILSKHSKIDKKT